MRAEAKKRLAIRRSAPAAPDAKKSLWSIGREYISFVIAVLAFGISGFTLYISHYGGPQDFRVTTYLPRVTQTGSNLDLNSFSDLVRILTGTDGSVEEKVPDDKAKSFKLAIAANIVFVNAGSAPVLVSSVSIHTPFTKGTKSLGDKAGVESHVDCQHRYFSESIKWTSEAFVVAPGAIVPKDISFQPYRSPTKINATFCFHFVVVDRSGEEKAFDTSDFSVDLEDEGKWVQVLSTREDVRRMIAGQLQFVDEPGKSEQRQTTVLLNSYF